MAEGMIRTRESTENIPSTRRVRDVWDRFLYVDPDSAPFTLLTKAASTRTAINSKFEWFEKNRAPKWDAVNNGAGYNATATSIVVDNGAYFFPGDVVNIPRTGEKMRVVSVATNTLTVVRAVDGDGVTGSAILDNDDLQIVGQAFAEGAALGTERTNKETAVFNLTQIFRWPFGATRTQSDSENYGGKTRPRMRAEAAIDHAIQIEEAFLFGERNIFTSGDSDASVDKPRRYTGGALYFLTANNKNAGGILSEPEMEDWAQNVFNATGSSSSTRLMLASPLIGSVIDQLAAGRLHVVPTDKTYGIAVMQWETVHGTFLITKDRLLESGATSGQGYGGYAIAIDPGKIVMRPFTNATTQLLIDRGNPGDDAWTDEYLSELGLQIENPSCHGVLSGVTG